MDIFLNPLDNLYEAIIGFFLILSSIGMISFKNPVHGSLSFLLTLLLLATLYMESGAEFIGIMQVLVYAGAILVIFMFVVILFQDAHDKITMYPALTNKKFLFISGIAFLAAVTFLLANLAKDKVRVEKIGIPNGTAKALGKALYVDFFFPFEAVVFLFLVAIIGAFYIGKKP